MSLKKLLSIPVLVVLAGLSVHHVRASSVQQSHVDSRLHQLLDKHADRINSFVTDTKRLGNSIEDTYFTYFVNSQFTSGELALYPDARKTIELMHDPMEAVATFDSGFDFAACKLLYFHLDLCANWSNSAMPGNPATARSFLHKANARLHLCLAALDDAAQQRALLLELSRAFDHQGGKSLEREYLPTPASSPTSIRQVVEAQDLKLRFDVFGGDMRLIFFRLALWSFRSRPIFKLVASASVYLADQSKRLTALAVKDDDCLAEELAVLSGMCQEERALLLPLNLSSTEWGM